MLSNNSRLLICILVLIIKMKRGSHSSSQKNFIARNIQNAKSYSRNRSQDPDGKKQSVKFDKSSQLEDSQPARIHRTKTPFVKSIPDEQVKEVDEVKFVTTTGTQTPPSQKCEEQEVPPSIEVMAVDSNLTEDLVVSSTPQVAEPTVDSPKAETGSQTETKNEESRESSLDEVVQNIDEMILESSHKDVATNVESDDVQPEQNPTFLDVPAEENPETPIQMNKNETALSPSSAKYEAILHDITAEDAQFSEEAQNEAVEKFLSQPDSGTADFIVANKENETSFNLEQIIEDESHASKEQNK